jgi:hypothetical protein
VVDGAPYDVSDATAAAARQVTYESALDDVGLAPGDIPSYPQESALYLDYSTDSLRATGDLAAYRVLSGAIHGKHWSLFMHDRRAEEKVGLHGLTATQVRMDFSVLVPLLGRTVVTSARSMDLRGRLYFNA